MQEVEKEVVKKVEAESGSDPPKSEESAAPCAAESEAKTEEKEIEAVDEEAKADPIEEKIEDKAVSVEVSPAGDQEKVDVDEKEVDVPVVEASDKGITPEPGVEKEECLSAPAEKVGEEKSIESSEDKLEEAVKVVDVAEVVEEKGETPSQVVEEATEPKDVAESKPEETAEAAPVVEQEQSQVAEQANKETPEAELGQEIEAKTPIDKAEELPKEEQTGPSEPPVSQVEEEKIDPNPVAVEVQQEEAADHGEIEAKAQVPQEKSVVAEELLHSEEKPTEDAKTSLPQPEAVEEVAKDEATSRDIDLVADNGNEKCASPETTNAQVEEVKETEAAAEKQVDEKIKETVEATEAKFEAAEAVKDSEDTKATKEDVPKVEEVPKEEVPKVEVPKEEVPVKTQKQSIVKIVKQSLVKAKKAIIGKSHNSKTPAPEAKDNANK